MIGILNSHMFGGLHYRELGEHVDWSKPDLWTRDGFEELVEQSVEDYAANNPWMIVFDLSDCPHERTAVDGCCDEPEHSPRVDYCLDCGVDL